MRVKPNAFFINLSKRGRKPGEALETGRETPALSLSTGFVEMY
jgi:hypothetical protein